jgi:DNA-binding transcriptional LysR family regulator
MTGKLQSWGVDGDTLDGDLKPTAHFVFNNTEAVLSAALHGLGIAYIPIFVAREALRSGQLIAVLQNCKTNQGVFWLLWPAQRHMLPRLRVFVDHLCEHLQIDPESP